MAQTNGFAPVSQAQYFAEQRLENVSPALAEVSGDWTGPNADGSPNTWHFVGTSRATSTTTITADSYTVEGSASFAYQVDSTPDFINPQSIGIFAPGGAAQYRGFFETDVPLVYAVTARLNLLGRVRLNQIGGSEIFDEINSSAVPQLLTRTGTISPGQYQILATASLGASNLPSGMHYFSASGSFDNLTFSVRIPEPSVLGFGTVLVARRLMQRRRLPASDWGTETGDRNGDATH